MNTVFDNDKPIYIQLVDMLRVEIVSGRLKSGDRLKSVRDFALDMRVNPNTMQKALSELEDEGLIFTERTNGKFVTNDAKLIEKVKKELALEKVKNYIDGMNKIGIDKSTAINYLKEMEK